MALRIKTFSQTKGGDAFFKAIGHPIAARQVPKLLAALRAGPFAVYDPFGFAGAFVEMYGLGEAEIAGYFVQDLEDLSQRFHGKPAQPVTDLKAAPVWTVFVASFDAARSIDQIRHLVPDGAEIISLDALRLPDDMLSVPGRYLSNLNFATNFAFFRDAEGQHTRLTTANYWSGYGADAPHLWCCLFGGDGEPLAEWREPLGGPAAAITIDSAEVRRRFGLAPFTGQLFVHAVRIAGHDVVKYALDTYGDDEVTLSCTHDANAWPADLYAGLPAPAEGERVVLWVQDSHPAPIPAGGVGLNLMGRPEVAWLDREIPGFGTLALDTRDLLPDARWPSQIEVRAGRHFVRPRYEVFAANGRSRIAHANVERVDLRPDPKIRELANLMGKGYVLPAPVLPTDRFRTTVLPTPMATCQDHLPVKVLVYDPQGREVGARTLGKLPRGHAVTLDAGEFLEQADRAGNGGAWGHLELVYDFTEGGEADGWLHGLFRYEDLRSGHVAETSFGAHIFNTVLTYKGEPQSYAARPPGLSTRLFLRLGLRPADTLCHLIYAASTPWHATSDTSLTLYDPTGAEIARRTVAVPCGGSLLWRASEMFGHDELEAAGDRAHVLVRDQTCRLFGYHGLLRGETAFSLDHMFGF